MSSIFSHTSILNITIFKNERRIKMQRKPSLLYNLVCIRKNDSTHFVCHSLILKMMTFLLLKHVSSYSIVNEKLIIAAPLYFGKKGVKLRSIVYYEWALPHKPAVHHMSLNGRGHTTMQS